MESTILGANDLSSFASPLEQVLRNVPRAHEKPLRQAIYNVLAGLAAGLIAFSTYYVVFVLLWPFFLPILWALMSGLVIHPHKTRLTEATRCTLSQMAASDTPWMVSLLSAATKGADWLADSFGSCIWHNWKTLSALFLTLVALHVGFTVDLVSLPAYIPSMQMAAFEAVQLKHVLSFIAVYLLFVMLLWTPDRLPFIRSCSAALWVLVLCFFLASSSFLCTIALLLALRCLISHWQGPTPLDAEADGATPTTSKFRAAVLSALERLQAQRDQAPASCSTPTEGQQRSSSTDIGRASRVEHPGVSALRKGHIVHKTPESVLCGGNVTHSTPLTCNPMRKHCRTILNRDPESQSPESQESDLYIRLVSWFWLLLQIWLHPILASLVPVVLLYSGLKKAALNLAGLLWVLISAEDRSACRAWLGSRLDALAAPAPLVAALEELARIKVALLRCAERHSDTIVTVLLILVCIMGSVLFVFIVSFQMYSDSVYLVQLGGRMLTIAANSSLYQKMGNDTSFSTGLEDAVEAAYVFGRQHLSSWLASVLGGTEIEQKVLELWDRVYQFWLMQRNATNFGPQLSHEAITTSMDEVVVKLASMDWSALSQLIMNNIGTVVSIAEQGWTLVISNASLTLGIVTEVIRIVFHSGSGMINFLFNILVYFTALFYLLKIEGPVYWPVAVISSVGGQLVGDGFAGAVDKAVNSVFKLTAKMAYFYGLWTYITHAIFQASIITLPVVAAAFLAVVPVAGQYLVALPAAMELWLAQDRWMAAIGLITCHLVPPYLVDTAIYAEIRHGIHPWITGLSIIGGIYCFGTPGAIYGPVILCVVFVVWTITMYTGIPFLAPSTLISAPTALGKTKLHTPMFGSSRLPDASGPPVY